MSKMDVAEWVTRFSARLHAQWPRIGREQRDEVARELQQDPQWAALEPEVAVVQWLKHGVAVRED